MLITMLCACSNHENEFELTVLLRGFVDKSMNSKNEGTDRKADGGKKG
jgi:hypothetical protein